MRFSGLRRFWLVELGESVVRSFFGHRMTTYAAALAYRGLFGLLPFILLVVALLAVFDVDGFFEWIIDRTSSDSSPQVPDPLEPVAERGREQAEPVRELVEQAQETAGAGLLSFGVIASLYSVYVATRTLTEALNAAYGITEVSHGWKRNLVSAVFGPALALVSILAVGLMLIGPRIAEWIAGLVGLDDIVVTLWTWLRLPTALLLLMVVLSVVYLLTPNASLSYKRVLPGAVFAVVAWAATSVGFSFYLANFADYGATYGSLGAAIGLLLYLYLSACVLLLGAELNAAIERLYPQRHEVKAR